MNTYSDVSKAAIDDIVDDLMKRQRMSDAVTEALVIASYGLFVMSRMKHWLARMANIVNLYLIPVIIFILLLNLTNFGHYE